MKRASKNSSFRLWKMYKKREKRGTPPSRSPCFPKNCFPKAVSTSDTSCYGLLGPPIERQDRLEAEDQVI